MATSYVPVGQGTGTDRQDPWCLWAQRGYVKASNERAKIMYPLLIMRDSLVSLQALWPQTLLVC